MIELRKAVVAAAALSLAAVGMSYAQGRGQGGPGRHDGPGGMQRAARFLELTEDQQARLAELREQGRPERERLHEASREAHERLRVALEAENPDPATVGQAMIDAHALRAEQEAERESFEAALQSLLTPEQQRKWEMMEASRAAGGGFGPGHGGRRGPRGPGGPGGPGGPDQR